MRRLDLTAWAPLAWNANVRAALTASTLEWVEVTSAAAIPQGTQELYERLFSNASERSSWDAIMSGIRAAHHGGGSGARRSHLVLALDNGVPVSFCLFCTLPFRTDEMVVLGLYDGTAEGYRGRGHEWIRLLVKRAIAGQDAQRLGRSGGVVGELGEMEFVGQGHDAAQIRFTRTRVEIYRRVGQTAMMLEDEQGRWFTPHLQPSLRAGAPPLLLHLAFAPREAAAGEGVLQIDRELVRALLGCYAANYGAGTLTARRLEGFTRARLARARRALLVPPAHLPDLVALAEMDGALRMQVERDFGSLAAQRQRIDEAFGAARS